MSVQKYETDALQEHVDSTSILISRLDQWRSGVNAVQQYMHGHYHLHTSTTSNLEKILKNVSEVPSFPSASGATNSAGAASPSQLSTVFTGLQSSVNALLQRSAATANGIKSTVLPPLEQVQTEIDKHYKALRSQGQKGMKEVDKSREVTQKHVEALAQVTASFGARNLSSHEDPYVLHRRAEAAVAEQVARENTQAEAALNVQQNFASLETHILQTIRQGLAQLAALTEGYDTLETETTHSVAQSFKNLDLPAEWQAFTRSNSDSLVPTTNFQRDPQYVTFTNKNHPSSQPVVQGLLSRKGTVLKQYSQGYYVLTPAGYLYQFKSAEPTIDATPELSLYIPESEVNKSSKPGEFTFRVVGKDALKTLSTRHKFAFKTNSQRDLDIWYNAIARMAGHVLGDDDTPDSPTDYPSSPVDPPTNQLAGASLNQGTRGSPGPTPAGQTGQSPIPPPVQNYQSPVGASEIPSHSAQAYSSQGQSANQVPGTPAAASQIPQSAQVTQVPAQGHSAQSAHIPGTQEHTSQIPHSAQSTHIPGTQEHTSQNPYSAQSTHIPGTQEHTSRNPYSAQSTHIPGTQEHTSQIPQSAQFSQVPSQAHSAQTSQIPGTQAPTSIPQATTHSEQALRANQAQAQTAHAQSQVQAQANNDPFSNF